MIVALATNLNAQNSTEKIIAGNPGLHIGGYGQIDFNLNALGQSYTKEAEKLLPNNNYIGFSLTQGNKYRRKRHLLLFFFQNIPI